MRDESKVTLLASASHCITHGYMTLFPAVMVVIAAENSMSFMDIGIVANIGYFLYGFGAFPAGYLADRYGSKRMLTIGILGMAFSSTLVGLSSSVWSFGVSYALLGAFASIHHPAGLSLIARRVQSKKGKALGIHGVMGNVGLFFTPLFAALCLMLFDSWRSAYMIYGGVGALFAVVLYFSRLPQEADLSFKAMMGRGKGRESSPAKPEGAEEESAAKELKPIFYLLPISLLLLYMGSILSGFIFRGSLTFFPTLFKEEILFITNNDEPVVMAGYLTTAILSLGLIGAWFGGYINDKLKRPELFPAYVFICVTPLLYLISRSSDYRLIGFAALFSLIYYSWQPAQNYLIAKYTKKASHGMGFGVNFFLIFGLGSMATATGGWITDDYGVDLFYLIMAGFAALATLAALAVFILRKYTIKTSWSLQKEG